MRTHSSGVVPRGVWFLLAASIVLWMMAYAPTVHAATITVQSGADDGSANVGNCPGASCRLRDAVAAASTDDTIDFASDMTISLTGTPITIDKSLTIDGTSHQIALSGSLSRLIINGAITVNLSHLTLANGYNASGNGGSINVLSGTVNITNCVFSNNTATIGTGGAVDSLGTVTISDSSFAGNTATAGGAILNGGTLTVTNSTFSGNSAGSAPVRNAGEFRVTNGSSWGGAIDNGGALTLVNCTFSGNNATAGGGAIANLYGTAHLKNSIFADSGAGDNCYNAVGATLVNDGNNIDSGVSCDFGSSNGSLSSTDPQVGVLTNGVHPLQFTSPAIDGVTYNTPNSCPSTDQRGEARDDLACDIGAYEAKFTDMQTVRRLIPSASLTTYGPAVVGIQYSGTPPGLTSVTKSTTWTKQPATAIGVFWEITPTVSSGFTLTLKLCYTAAELGTLVEANLRFWHYDSGSWSQVGGVPTLSDGSAAYRCAEISVVTGLSRWTLATGRPTAVTLTAFAATPPDDLMVWLTRWLGYGR